MKKQDIKNLEVWEDFRELEFDYIYIVPTTQKRDGYRLAYYIGRIGDEYKIIELYDCGSILAEVKDNYFLINWDFEDIFGGIKIWRNGGKIKYLYGGRIEPYKKTIKVK